MATIRIFKLMKKAKNPAVKAHLRRVLLDRFASGDR